MNWDGLVDDLFSIVVIGALAAILVKKNSEQSRFTLGKENREWASKQTCLHNVGILYRNW